MKKIIIVVVSLATSIFGIEPSELVRFYRAALTNNEAMVELREVLQKHGRESIWETQSRMNGLELLLMHGGIDSVFATSENLAITFRGDSITVRHNGVMRRSTEYMENNEALILAPDQEASFSSGLHAHIRLTPVSLKNKRKGVRIIDVFSFSGDERRDVAYIALGDTLIPVSEEDVEMIMEDGEWKKFERDVEATASPPSREKTVTTTNNETPVNTAEDGQEEGKSKASNLWLYAIIPLGLLAVLWVVKRKRKRDSP